MSPPTQFGFAASMSAGKTTRHVADSKVLDVATDPRHRDPVNVRLAQLFGPAPVARVELSGRISARSGQQLLQLNPENPRALRRARRVEPREAVRARSSPRPAAGRGRPRSPPARRRPGRGSGGAGGHGPAARRRASAEARSARWICISPRRKAEAEARVAHARARRRRRGAARRASASHRPAPLATPRPSRRLRAGRPSRGLPRPRSAPPPRPCAARRRRPARSSRGPRRSLTPPPFGTGIPPSWSARADHLRHEAGHRLVGAEPRVGPQGASRSRARSRSNVAVSQSRAESSVWPAKSTKPRRP